jgi:hypothetical protein
VIWFVNSAVTGPGDGRLSNPFKVLSGNAGTANDADDVDAANQRIFLFSSAMNYTGGLTLNSGEWLIGQGVTGSGLTPFDTLFGIAPPAGTIARPTLSGTPPVIQGTVTLNTNAVVKGLAISTGASTGMNDPVSSISGVTVDQVSLTTTTGTALALSDVTGTGSTASQLTFTGVTTSGGAGVALTGTNTNTTFMFAGGIAISSGANAGFSAIGATSSATSGGTVNITGSANTITSATGTALNVANTIIGGNGLTFRSISASGAPSGIVLNNTGASGGLTVTGGGNTAVGGDNSGGTIQNTSGQGVSLTSTRNVSLTNLNIQNTVGHGVGGTAVTNFTFSNGKINNSKTDALTTSEEANIGFFVNETNSTRTNLDGTVNIVGNQLTNAQFHGIDIFNFSGTILNANISQNTITSSTLTTASQGSGIRLVGFGSATTVASINSATINQNTVTNFPSGTGIMVQGGNANSSPAAPAGVYGTSAASPIAITNNIVSGASATNRIGTQGVLTVVNGKGSGFQTITGNTVSNTLGTSIAVSSFGFATVTAKVTGNTIVANNTVGSQGIGAGTGVTVANTETPTLNITVGDGTVAGRNTISQTDGNGILLVARDASGRLNASVKGNNVAAPLGGVRPGIRVDAGNTNSADDAVCLDISGNTSAGSGGSQGIGLRKQGTITTTNDFGVEGMAATASPGVETFVDGQNPAGAGTLLISATSGFSNCSSAP